MNPEGGQVDAVVRVLDASSKLERSGNGRVEGGAIEAIGDAEDGSDEGETDGEAVVLVGALFGDAGVEVGCDDGVSEGHFDGDGFPGLGNISCFRSSDVDADGEGGVESGEPSTESLNNDVQDETLEGHALGDEHGEGDGGVEVGA